MYYLTTDTHLGHENIKKYCNRPDDFEKRFLANWKTCVKPSDVVIHLGDLTFKEDWVEKTGKLPGTKILVMGNHDKLSYEEYIKFGWIPMETFSLEIQGIRILFSHRPIYGHEFDINFHGHQHDLSVLDPTRLYLPVALEHMRYGLIPMNSAFMKEIRSIVDRNEQPKAEDLGKLFKSDRKLDSVRDFYGGFGKEAYEKSQKRLFQSYEILKEKEFIDFPRKKMLWEIFGNFIEGRISSEKELRRKLKEVMRKD